MMLAPACLPTLGLGLAQWNLPGSQAPTRGGPSLVLRFASCFSIMAALSSDARELQLRNRTEKGEKHGYDFSGKTSAGTSIEDFHDEGARFSWPKPDRG